MCSLFFHSSHLYSSHTLCQIKNFSPKINICLHFFSWLFTFPLLIYILQLFAYISAVYLHFTAVCLHFRCLFIFYSCLFIFPLFIYILQLFVYISAVYSHFSCLFTFTCLFTFQLFVDQNNFTFSHIIFGQKSDFCHSVSHFQI